MKVYFPSKLYDMVLAGFILTLIHEIMCLNLKTGVELCFGDFVEDLEVISVATGEEKQEREGRGGA